MATTKITLGPSAQLDTESNQVKESTPLFQAMPASRLACKRRVSLCSTTTLGLTETSPSPQSMKKLQSKGPNTRLTNTTFNRLIHKILLNRTYHQVPWDLYSLLRLMRLGTPRPRCLNPNLKIQWLRPNQTITPRSTDSRISRERLELPVHVTNPIILCLSQAVQSDSSLRH